MKVNVGLDIGVASVGVAVIDSETGEVLEVFSDLFPCADASENVKRRGFRQARRLKRRQRTRISDFKKCWEQNGLPIPDDININVLKLRVKALNEKISLEELYLVLLYELKHRGISYLEDADDVSGNSDYAKGIKLNQIELKNKYPCEIQNERLNKYGVYRGQIVIMENNEKVVLSNIFTFGSYKKEIDRILQVQGEYYSEITTEFIRAYKDIFGRKREYYTGPGNEKSRTDYGKYTTKIDLQTGEYITEENIFEKLIGKCSVYPEEMRASAASYTAQEFNLLNDLNNLSIGGRKLSEDEKRKIIDAVKNNIGRINIEKIICSISGEDAETIEGARIDKEDKHIYHSFEVYRKMKASLLEIGFSIDELSRDELDEIGHILTLNTEKEAIINEFSRSSILLSAEVIECLISVRKSNGSLFNKWHSFSLKLMNDIIPDMYEQPKEQMTLLSEMGLIKSHQERFTGLKYIPEEAMTDAIYNPVVVRSIRVTLKALNAIIKKYGYPNMVVVEMPRDKNDDEQKKRIKDEQAKNESELKGIIDKIDKEYGIKITDSTFRNHKQLALKLKLWNEQQGICLYSGKKIPIDRLLSNAGDFEIDHIIPLSISFDDSRSNKVLVYRTENQEKSNSTPYGYMSTPRWEEFKSRVISLKKELGDKKCKNLKCMEDITKVSVLKGFINRNLNDTRYASKVVLNTLQDFFDANNTGTKVSVIRGAFTSIMRKNLKLKKDRDESYAHHAVDAMLIAYSKMGYDSFKKLQDGFIDFETGEILDKRMYEKNMDDEVFKDYVYGQKWVSIRDNITKAENQVKYWHMTNKKCNRGLCDQTIYGTREYDGETYKIGKIKDIRTKEGYKKFCDLKDDNLLLIARNDPKTYENLLQICKDYKGEPNPFVAYEKETGDVVRKYSKHHNGPKIVSLKYIDGVVGSCIDISHKYGFEKNSRKVVLGKLVPYRMDVYYKDGKYFMVGIKQSDVKCDKGRYVIDEDAYSRALIQEKLIEEGSDRSDLTRRGYEFRMTFFENDIIEYEKNGKIYRERFLSRTMPKAKNYIETKPVSAPKFVKQNLVGLSATKSVKKIRTDIMGNIYYCEKEEFSIFC